MMTFCLPDTTVLVNYGSVGRIDLLETYLDRRGRWVESVWHEARKASSVVYELRRMKVEDLEGFLGPPIAITDHDAVEDIRVGRLGASPSEPFKNLGEAETLHLIMSDPAFKDAIWISDDRQAARFAERRGVTTVDTTGVMESLCSGRILSAQEGYNLLRQMADAGNKIRLPASAHRLAL
jgi:predicted nucleic acid-binding protein